MRQDAQEADQARCTVAKQDDRPEAEAHDGLYEEEDEESPEVSLNVPEEEEESLEPPDLTKSLDDLTKGKALKKRDAAPPVLKAIKEEETLERVYYYIQ